MITGFSGAGKSTAMNVFEDAGYFCVDNLPPEMIRSLVELFVHKGSKVERAAVVSDVRGGVYFEALRAVVDDLDALGLDHHVLFLEAAEQTLVTRYKETRRRHPLAPEGSVAAGVAAERALLEPLREPRRPGDRHDRHVGGDAARARSPTSCCRASRRAAGADVHELRLQARPAARGGPGVRRALPAQPPLRARAARADRARPARWSSTSRRDGRLEELYERLHALLDFLLPQYVAEGKAHLVIAIGCTGGRHRSVAIAEHLAARYRERDDLTWRSPTATSTSARATPDGRGAAAAARRAPPMIDHVGFEVSGPRALGGLLRRGVLRDRRAPHARERARDRLRRDGPELLDRHPRAAARRRATGTSPSAPLGAWRSTAPTRPASPTAGAATASPGCGRTTGRSTTPPTCVDPDGLRVEIVRSQRRASGRGWHRSGPASR